MQFSIAGMSSSTSSHNSPSWTTSSGPNASLGNSTLSDSFASSRPLYQSGYMMSNSQTDTATQGSQRMDEVPIVETKAKMNQRLARSATSDFGMESMFKSTRRRSALIDEDAPPRNSVNDIPIESNVSEPRSIRQQPTTSMYESLSRPPALHSSTQSYHYIIVFGYPPDKYSLTVEYFRTLGGSTEADPHADISNAFRIGFADAGAAMRAVRKSGEILGGSWMIGVKWADDFRDSNPKGIERAMTVDQPSTPVAAPSRGPPPTVGTPIRLAPSTAAFRKPGATPVASPMQRAAPQPSAQISTPQKSSEKGVVAQMSDLIFGW